MSDSDSKQQQYVILVRKEDDLWSSLGEDPNTLYDFIVATLQESDMVPDEVVNLSLKCMKVCLTKSILDKDKYYHKRMNFKEFLSFMDTALFSLNKPLIEQHIKDIRNVMWGHVRMNMPFLVDMAKEYMSEVASSATPFSNSISMQKTEMLFSCVAIAYIEIRLREKEAKQIEEMYENEDDYRCI